MKAPVKQTQHAAPAITLYDMGTNGSRNYGTKPHRS